LLQLLPKKKKVELKKELLLDVSIRSPAEEKKKETG